MMEKHYIKDYIVFKDDTARVVGKEYLKAEIVARAVVDVKQTVDEVMTHYNLTRAQVHATLTYYYENQEDLDRANNTFWQNDDLMTRAKLLERINKRQSDRNEQ